MANEDGSLQLVFNGEIYNFLELRDLLEKKGHRFLSRSDSEVILHGYEEWGDEVLQQLRGMFAFALWDRRQQRLLAGRDRLGIKPFYYYHQEGRLAFASEIKGLLTLPDIPRRVNPQALYDYLGYEFVPSPQTMFEGILKLPPGHFLTLSNRGFGGKPYWDIRFSEDWRSPRRRWKP